MAALPEKIIEYIFDLGQGQEIRFRINANRENDPSKIQTNPHEWTLLSHCQCEHCPLSSQTHKYCPAALDMEEIINRFSPVVSFKKVNVTVKTADRDYHKCCDAQTGVNSLLGLVMATSGCPVFADFRSIAHHHLPFSSFEETLYRVVGDYLIKQYFSYHDGKAPDMELEGLTQRYEKLEEVNRCFAKRIQEVCTEESSINAFVMFFGISNLITCSLKTYLDKIRKTHPGLCDLDNTENESQP